MLQITLGYSGLLSQQVLLLAEAARRQDGESRRATSAQDSPTSSASVVQLCLFCQRWRYMRHPLPASRAALFGSAMHRSALSSP